MKRLPFERAVLIEIAIALVIAGLLILLAPGLALVGLVALIVLLVVGITFLVEFGFRRRRRRIRQRTRPRAQPPFRGID